MWRNKILPPFMSESIIQWPQTKYEKQKSGTIVCPSSWYLHLKRWLNIWWWLNVIIEIRFFDAQMNSLHFSIVFCKHAHACGHEPHKMPQYTGI